MPGGWELGHRPLAGSQRALSNKGSVTGRPSLCVPAATRGHVPVYGLAPQHQQEGSGWHRICCIDRSVWRRLPSPLLDLHLFFRINDTLLSPPRLMLRVTTLLFWLQVEILSLSDCSAFTAFFALPGLRAGEASPRAAFASVYPPHSLESAVHIRLLGVLANTCTRA